MALFGGAGGAEAQVAVSGTITTDYRYRGVSLSDDRPALSVDLSYDADNGVYLGGSIIGGHDAGIGERILGHLEYLGYARPVGSGLTWDVGVSHATFVQYPGGVGGENNADLYTGLRTRHFNYYLHYSPDYFGGGVATLYAEAEASARPARHWRLFAHLGVLAPLHGALADRERAQYDARAGVAATFKRGELSLSVTAARPELYVPQRDALVLAATCFF